MPTAEPPLDLALRLFRAAAPGVTGVVLASADGHPVAHDLATQSRAGWAAHAAVALHHGSTGAAPLARAEDGASVFVPSDDGLLLVVFVPQTTTLPADPLAA